MARKAKPRHDLTEEDRARALDRNLDAYMRPSHVDDALESLELDLARAADDGRGFDLTLTPQQTLCLHLALSHGHQSKRIIRELAVETFKLKGMKELARYRRDEILAANYESLRAGGYSGDGVVTLHRPDEAVLGVRGTTFAKEYGGPLDPARACEALAEWTGESYEGVRKALRDAKRRLSAANDLQIGDLPPSSNRRPDIA